MKKRSKPQLLTVARSSLQKDGIIIGATTPQTVFEVRIDEHRKALERRGPQRRCYRSCCSRCEAPGPFAPHDVRQRGLCAIVGSRVLEFSILIARWRCRTCRCVFTDYPDFRNPL